MSNHRTQILETLAERVMRSESTHKNVAFTQLQGQVISLKNSVDALNKLHANPNPIETKEAHFKRVSTAANQLREKTKDMKERINHIIQQGLKDAEGRIKTKVNLAPDAYAAEIRQTFRAMKQQDQIKLLNQLAKENRGPELAAIVKAPITLTGLSEKTHSTYSEMIFKLHAPEEWQESLDLTESFSNALAACDVGKTIVTEYSDPQKLAEIESREAAAHQANSEFSNSLVNM